ncbi:hypothetical protein [Nonlabens spongiae]|nr:hypothetical protein [Nonlabens spongiae]
MNLPALATRQAGAYSQNDSRNIINSSIKGSDFEVVDIVFDTYVALEIGNSTDGKVLLFEEENGEYKNAIQVRRTIEKDSLKLINTKSLSFEFPQDKLSAHKVINTSLKLLIPEGKKVIINVREATVLCEGSFESIYVNQLSGTCKFKMIESDVTVVSVYADIDFELSDLQNKQILRENQKMKFWFGKGARYSADLQTIHGNISLER